VWPLAGSSSAGPTVGGSRKKGAARTETHPLISDDEDNGLLHLGQGPPVGEEYGDRSPCKRIVPYFQTFQPAKQYICN
jgi:hypothetical protein